MRWSALVVCVLGVSIAACSSNSGGGDVSRGPTGPVDLGTPIGDANNPAHPLVKTTCGSQCPPGDATCPQSCPSLSANGAIVVAIDAYDETGDGKSIGNIYIQDASQPAPRGTPYSGITLFRAQRIPSDLPLHPGDGVDVDGTYQPFPGPASGAFAVPLPEVVNGSLKLAYEGCPSRCYRPPTPIDVTADDFKDPKAGFAFVGRLVRMQNVTVTGVFAMPRQEAAIDGSADSKSAKLVAAGQFISLVDAKAPAIVPGKTYKSVTGLLNYFYNFKLCPRSLADIEP